jgi:hypothetical protein
MTTRAYRISPTQLRVLQVALASVALAFGDSAARGETVKLADYLGITATGQIDSAAAINRAIGSGGNTIIFPCGTFVVAETLALPSNTEVSGSGLCTIIKLSKNVGYNPNWAFMPRTESWRSDNLPANVFANSNFRDGNSNIRIRDLVIDASEGTGGARRVHLIGFYKTSDVEIEGLRFIGSGTPDIQDAIAMVNVSDYVIKNNYSINTWNACYDQWDGSHDFRIENNVCDGGGIAASGILINGLSSAHRTNTTFNGIVTQNEIRHVRNCGIYVGGLWNESRENPVYGVVANIRVENNSVAEISRFHGIIVSDGHDIAVRNNKIANVAREGIRVGSQFRGRTENILIARNSVQQAGVAGVPDDAIKITNGAQSVTLAANIVGKGQHRYAVSIDPGTFTTTLDQQDGTMASGTAGVVLDRGR